MRRLIAVMLLLGVLLPVTVLAEEKPKVGNLFRVDYTNGSYSLWLMQTRKSVFLEVVASEGGCTHTAIGAPINYKGVSILPLWWMDMTADAFQLECFGPEIFLIANIGPIKFCPDFMYYIQRREEKENFVWFRVYAAWRKIGPQIEGTISTEETKPTIGIRAETIMGPGTFEAYLGVDPRDVGEAEKRKFRLRYTLPF